MEERKNFKNQKNDGIHNVIMEGRRKASISGVCDVESFNEEEIVLHTNMGIMTIEGDMMHINKLSTENGEVMIEGNIESIKYVEEKFKGGFWQRLLK